MAFAPNSIDLTKPNAGQPIDLSPIDLSPSLFGGGVSFGNSDTNIPNASSIMAASPNVYLGEPAPSGQRSGATTTSPSNRDPYAVGGSGYNADNAYLDAQEGQLKNLLKSAQTTLGNGLTQIDDSFAKTTGRANEDRMTAAAGYNTQREDTTRNKMAGINQVNTGARTLNDSLRRILGMASGANSSAYQLAAPNAVARDASMKRTGVVETAGRNFRNIDTADTNNKTAFDRLMQDLAEQRKQKEQGLREGVLTQEQGINQSLAEVARQRALLQGGGYSQVQQAMAPYSGAINQGQAALDALFSQFRTPYNAPAVQAEAPQLSTYNVDRTAINAANGGGEQYSPYASFLKRKQQGV